MINFNFTHGYFVSKNKLKRLVSLSNITDGKFVDKMEHEKPLRGQSKFSNTNGLSVDKIKIQNFDKKK